MKRVVYKYVLLNTINRINLPPGARVLHIGEQERKVYMWVMLNPDCNTTVSRKFEVVPTGEKFDDDELEFLGTVVMKNEEVYHVFEILN